MLQTHTKTVLLLFNSLFLLLGVVLLSSGIWLLGDPRHFLTTFGADEILVTYKSDPSLEDLKMLYTQFAYVLISVGLFITGVCLLGILGTLKGNRVILLVYSLLLFVILMFVVISTILLAVYETEVVAQIKHFLQNSLQERYTGDSSHIFTKAWDFLQSNLKCCGVMNYTDFNQTTSWTVRYSPLAILPASCCSTEDKTLLTECTENHNLYVSNANVGCLGRLVNLVRQYGGVTLATIIAICCGLLLMMLSASYLTIQAYSTIEVK
ncbi:tetraspanin-1-like [Octopus sinensis]|uniref:Tetraspanin n=1 Tax=Octopus sinensis TaxID=2607531 RepID=A0A6P7TU97_9MOLL|nr:tetraspanin-1-like [Octopus sinensis]